MQFTLKLTSPTGKAGIEQNDLLAMRQEMAELAKMLDLLAVGEVIEIKRIS